MSHSHEQKRKKHEAMQDAAHHHMHSTVDGEPARPHNSHMAHMKADNMHMKGQAYMENMEKGE